MTKRQKALIVLLTPFLLGFLLGILVGGACSKKERPVAEEPPVVQEEILEPVQEQPEVTEPAPEEDDVDGTGESTAREIIYDARRMAYATIFDDINDLHLEKAREKGLKSIPEKRDAVDTKLLVKVEESDYLTIDELRYSVPYLTPGAAGELNRIAKAFNDSLTRKQLPVYKLVCSSILRTEEDVARLRKSGNPNASDNSAHCYGTTFDITYTKYDRDEETDEFMQPFELTKVLGEVLRDEKNAGRILVKYERKEHCFHITSCQ